MLFVTVLEVDMTVLTHYTQFDGLHWETGTIRNTLAYQGVVAPHTGKPYSEALLMGVSGGAAFGYFLFDYQGFDPIISLITRNTFDPMDTILERLGIPQTVLQTTHPKKAEENLLKILAGLAFSLPDGVCTLPWLGFHR